MRNRDRTLIVFGSVYGEPPWNCFFCGGIINALGEGVIHHKNEDHTDDSSTNLVPSHRTCHSSYHVSGDKHPMYGKHHTEEAKEKIRQNHANTAGENNGMFGKQHTDETKAKMSAARLGVSKSEEHKSKISAGNAGKGGKLNSKQVIEIRRLWDESDMDQQQIAEMFGVSQTNISMIIRRKTWTHI